MAELDRNISGIMSRNDHRERDSQPEFTGTATIYGVDYFMDAWVNERKDGSGRKFFKVKFKRRIASGMPERPTTAREIKDDALPF